MADEIPVTPPLAQAAGVLFLSGGRVLLLQRGPGGDHPGTWAFPGGGVEAGESPQQAAVREVLEETGHTVAEPALVEHARRIADGVEFHCFLVQGGEQFAPVLNDEHGAFVWASPGDLPANIHPGVKIMLARIDMDELDCAHAIRDGLLASPIRYRNIWLFDMRITGTGAAYRNRLDEYAYRDPDFYLNEHTLERCQGLNVVWEHPDGTMMNGQENSDRSVGAMMVPYIDLDGVRHPADEVWGIAKIIDESAAIIMANEQMSTSPGVVLRAGPARKIELGDGTKVLVENKPALLDHLAICRVGVWDKADPARGVNTTGDPIVDDEAKNDAEDKVEEKVDAKKDTGDEKMDAGAEGNLDKVLSHIDAKLDAWGEKMDARIDARMDARMDAKKDSADGKDQDEKSDKKDAGDGDVMADKKDGADDGDDGKAEKMASDKKDAGAVDEDARKDSADALSTARATAARLDDVERAVKGRTDEDEHVMTAIQARADGVAQMFGEHAPRFQIGEGSLAYRRRLAAPYRKYSNDWKDADLAKFDSAHFDVVEKQIWDSAAAMAKNPARHTGGTLQAITKSSFGHEITEYAGSPRSWMDDMAGPARQHVTSILTPNGAG